jgi:hypothetical protein
LKLEREKAVATNLGGYWYRLGHDGRFAYVGDIGLGASPGDGCVCVVNYFGNDVGAPLVALYAAGAIPLPISGRWKVDYQALMFAIQAGNRVILTPTTS